MELGAEMTTAVPRVGKWRWTGCSFTFTINTHLFTLPQHQHHRGKKIMEVLYPPFQWNPGETAHYCF